jgi:hypothetical protein
MRTARRSNQASSMASRTPAAGGVRMAVFPYTEKAAGGALVQEARRKPVSEGVLIYLNTQGRLDACVQRTAKAAGAVLMPKLDIGDPGSSPPFGTQRETSSSSTRSGNVGRELKARRRMRSHLRARRSRRGASTLEAVRPARRGERGGRLSTGCLRAPTRPQAFA